MLSSLILPECLCQSLDTICREAEREGETERERQRDRETESRVE